MVKRSSSKQADPSLLAPAWGSLWGVALGTWVLLPDIVDSHHIRPETGTQWALLVLAFVVIFATMGAFLGFLGGFLLAIAEHLTIGSFRDRAWGYGLFTGVLLILGYAFEDYVVHFTTFWSFDNLSFYSTQVKAIVLFALGALACLSVVYAVVTRRASRLRPIVLVILLAAAGATGALAAPVRCGVENLESADVGSLLPATATDPGGAPLLFIGLDGATWRVLGPAMDRGLAPTFRSLRDRGTSGDVEALWPPYWSGAAWGSILTGLPREATGVYEDLGGVAPGLSPFQVPLLSSFKLNPIYTARSLLRAARMIDYVPPPRALLRGKPVWQLLHEAGVNSAVIRFRFTYPPTDQADVMVSDWIGSDPWEEMGVRHLNTPDTVAPASLAQELLAPFRPESAAPTLFSRLVPGPEPRQPADAILDPFAHIRAAADVDERSFQASMVVLRHNPRQPFLAVYIGGLDSAEHAFWQYRFPEDFTSNLPAAEDVKRFAPVIDRYVQFVDERLKMLLAQYDAEPNIVVVSDHGHGASTILGGWRGWHTRTGVFLAAGPSVPKTDVRLKVSYYDIVPTLASLKGLQKSSGLRGVALFREKQSSDVVSNSH